MLDMIQLSPEGEVNRLSTVEVYIQRCSPILRGVVVLVFAKSVG